MLREELPEIITEHVPGPKAEALLKKRDEALPKALCGYTYPICIKRGEGAILEDVDGNKFLDFIGGVGVLNIGYSRPEVVEAVKEQAEKYFHCIFNVVAHEGYIELARQFDELMPCRGEKKKTFFANSGAEADENAIKVAKAYTGRHSIICFSGAFHGRTNLTMALTAKKSYALGMGPFPSGIYRAEFPYLYRAPKGYTEEEAIEYYVQKLTKLFDEAAPASDVAAILVEPIQGEGGFIPAPIEWVKAVRKICDDNGILLIADEVQCGNCRSGKYFASEYWKEAGAAPDIISTAKSMGGGVPISAITARAEIMDAVPAGTIGGTYCGNPLACAAVSKVFDMFKSYNLLENVKEVSAYLIEKLNGLKDKYDFIKEIRGLGLMQGMELSKPVGDIIIKAQKKGLVIISAGACVLRFVPPLVINKADVDKMITILDECFAECNE